MLTRNQNHLIYHTGGKKTGLGAEVLKQHHRLDQSDEWVSAPAGETQLNYSHGVKHAHTQLLLGPAKEVWVSVTVCEEGSEAKCRGLSLRWSTEGGSPQAP